MTQVAEEISVADPNLDPETWVDQYGDYLYRFALAISKKMLTGMRAVALLWGDLHHDNIKG